MEKKMEVMYKQNANYKLHAMLVRRVERREYKIRGNKL